MNFRVESNKMFKIFHKWKIDVKKSYENKYELGISNVFFVSLFFKMNINTKKMFLFSLKDVYGYWNLYLV